jgi:hypothetical protein
MSIRVLIAYHLVEIVYYCCAVYCTAFVSLGVAPRHNTRTVRDGPAAQRRALHRPAPGRHPGV